jgi:hypothetical protein
MGLSAHIQVLSEISGQKKSASRLKEADSTKLSARWLARLMEKEPDTGAYQLLAQSAILVGIDLGALIIKVFILDERAPLGIEKVIGTGNHIERQVRMT